MDDSGILLRAYYFGSADDKFVKDVEENPETVDVQPKTLTSYQYEKPHIFPTRPSYKKNDLPITCRISPESLLNLAASAVGKWKLPKVYEWTIEDICKWLRQNGFSQYQHTFRVNLVNGRTLLLVDAAALSAMNIKDFDHIRRLTYLIRSLFYFEMTKFGRSISLAPHFLQELYKLFRVKTGRKYEETRNLDLWQKMKLIRERTFRDYRLHWDILEDWLKFKPENPDHERIGLSHRYNLYKCKSPPKIDEQEHEDDIEFVPCKCLPPCECFWTEKNLMKPWTLNILPQNYKRYSLNQNSVLSVLNLSFPDRYRPPTVRSLRKYLSRLE